VAVQGIELEHVLTQLARHLSLRAYYQVLGHAASLGVHLAEFALDLSKLAGSQVGLQVLQLPCPAARFGDASSCSIRILR
jgi:hypothetical protein